MTIQNILIIRNLFTDKIHWFCAQITDLIIVLFFRKEPTIACHLKISHSIFLPFIQNSRAVVDQHEQLIDSAKMLIVSAIGINIQIDSLDKNKEKCTKEPTTSKYNQILWTKGSIPIYLERYQQKIFYLFYYIFTKIFTYLTKNLI